MFENKNDDKEINNQEFTTEIEKDEKDKFFDKTTDVKTGGGDSDDTPVVEDKVDDKVGDKQDEVVDANTVEKSTDEQEKILPRNDITEGAQEQSSEVPDADKQTQDDKEVKVETEEEHTPVDDIEQLKKEVAEFKQKQFEMEQLKTLEVQRQKDAYEFNNVCIALGKALEKTYNDLGIDTSKSLDELRKSDPDKAAKAEQAYQQAMAIQQDVLNKQAIKTQKAIEQIVFSKAGRLIDSFELTKEQTNKAAEAFIDILNATGLADLDDDLMTKVEYAVGRVKLRTPKADKPDTKTEPVMTKTEAVTENATKTIEPEKIEAIKKDDKQTENSVPKVDIAAFTEDVAPGVQNFNDSVNVGNVLSKLKDVPHRDRVNFYKTHYSLIQQAMKEEQIKRANERKV